MSTLPSMPDHHIPYTMIEHQGGEGQKTALLPFSIVLLHRSKRFERSEIFDRMHRLQAADIISVEMLSPRCDLEEYSKSYREIRFLSFSQAPATVGQAINTAMLEARNPFVLVMWSDQQLLPVSRAHFDEIESHRILCTIPFMRNAQGTVLPTLASPAGYRSSLKVLRLVPTPEQKTSLYPYDYCGLYHKESFLQTTGFDPLITNQYWQTMDFGWRSWLWGYKLQASSGLRLQILEDLFPEDTSADTNYSRFYAKNFLPDFLADHGHLSWRRFWHFKSSTNLGIIEAIQQYREYRDWVNQHRFRFKHEARYVAELWEEEFCE